MRYRLVWRRAADQMRIAGAEEILRAEYRYIDAECDEDELIGMKEKLREQLEDREGGTWICTGVNRRE